MSGLAVHLAPGERAVEERRLEAMAAAVPYRAPAGLARIRLGPFAGAVLASGSEDRPWLSADGRLAVVADSRLLGRAELARRLARELEADRAPAGGPPCDAALLAAGWRRWGEALPEHLDGDFAVALWDLESRRLLLARDSAGSRPLVWTAGPGGLAAASEPAQLLVGRRRRDGAPAPPAPDRRLREPMALDHGLHEREDLDPGDLDPTAVAAFLALDFRPTGRTLHAGIHRLSPGHRVVADPGAPPRVERWWRPEEADVPRPSSPEGWAEAFRERLERAVAGRLGRAGGGAAVLLSGGLDSSTVTVAARASAPEVPLHLLTHVFPTFPTCDESTFAAAVADHLGLPLHRVSAERDLVPVDPAALSMAVPGVPREPWVAAQEGMVAPLLDLAAGLGGRTVLTGLGGDALFDAARHRYRDDVRSGRWWRLAPWIADRRRRGASWPRALGGIVLKPLLPAALEPRLDRSAARRDGRPWRRRQVPPWVAEELARATDLAARLAGRDAARAVPRSLRGTRRRQYDHLVDLAQQAATVDALESCAARRGLEVAHPLLDRRLGELVLAAPLALGAVPGPAGTKHLLRRTFGHRLPAVVRRRDDKAGWGPYLAHLLRGPTGRRAGELLRRGELAARGYVDGAVLAAELERFRRGDGPYGDGLWFVPPLLLELWLRAAGGTAEAAGVAA